LDDADATALPDASATNHEKMGGEAAAAPCSAFKMREMLPVSTQTCSMGRGCHSWERVTYDAVAAADAEDDDDADDIVVAPISCVAVGASSPARA